MSFFRAVRRHDQWRVVLSLYDGRACPDCGAVVVGRDYRNAHRHWHTAQTEFDSRLLEAVRRCVLELGLNPVTDVGEPPAYAETADDRLARKARGVLQADDYDDEDEEIDGMIIG
jgi:hypothetical protein